jgi:methionyl-tRNA formyltransferase
VKVVVLLNEDLPALYALNHLLDSLLRHESTFFLSRSVGRPGPTPRGLRELKAQEQGLLRQVLNRLPPRTTPQEFRTFSELAHALGCEGAYLDRPRDSASRKTLATLAPDVIFSVRYGGILDADHVRLARHGILNLHSGALPAYRGVLASFRAVSAGEVELTATLHRIVDRGIDTGPILASATLPFDPTRALLGQIIDLYGPGCQLIAEALSALEKGAPLPGTPQDPASGAYFSKPTGDELQAFEAQGHRLCDLEDTLSYLTPFLS